MAMWDIPGFDTFLSVEPVEKGWSGERKFRVTTADGRCLLLRLVEGSLYERKQAEFRAMEAVWALGVPMSQPLELGRCEDGRSVYELLSWVEGEDAESALPTLPVRRQYALGRRAGEVLRAIHSIPAPVGQESWEPRFRRKTERKIATYRACPVHFEGDGTVIDYLQSTQKLLVGRPQCFQHGDYHVGNLILTPQGDVGVIDFNRLDYGDPWEEFNRIVWCAAASPAFAAGRIDGYFADDVPPEFFPLLAYYIAANTLSSVYWAIPFGQAEMDTMLRQAADVLCWFDGFQNPVPAWYREAQKGR